MLIKCTLSIGLCCLISFNGTSSALLPCSKPWPQLAKTALWTKGAWENKVCFRPSFLLQYEDSTVKFSSIPYLVANTAQAGDADVRGGISKCNSDNSESVVLHNIKALSSGNMVPIPSCT